MLISTPKVSTILRILYNGGSTMNQTKQPPRSSHQPFSASWRWVNSVAAALSSRSCSFSNVWHASNLDV